MSLIILRVVVCIIIASHGWHRLITGGYEPFGNWLDSQGIPFGIVVAGFITLFEVVASPLLAWGKKIPQLCTVYIAIYFSGLVMVHWQHGWFVVGSGSNGIEFSTLLLAALVSIALPNYQQLWRNWRRG
jgi:putative oxidoreductase